MIMRQDSKLRGLNRSGTSHVYHLFVIRAQNREKLRKYLDSKGIKTVVQYPIPPHKQQAYKEFERLSLPITEKIHKEVLSIPANIALTDEEIKKIVEEINAY